MDHDSDPSYTLALAATFLVLCPIVTALRFYTRISTTSKWALGLDDWLTVPATVLLIGCASVVIAGVRIHVLAYPTPKSDPGNANYAMLQKLEFAFFLMQIPLIGAVKLSFVVFFRRIFCVDGPRALFHVLSACAAILVISWTAAFWFWWLFLCHPFSARWSDIKTSSRGCPSGSQWDMGYAISDFLTDLMIIILPVPMVWRLHMRTSRKLIVLAVFALGLVALVASTIRMAIWITAITVKTDIITHSKADEDLNVTRGIYWTMLESGLSLIACCLPTLNPLLRLPSLRSVVNSIRSLASLGSRDSNPRQEANGAERLGPFPNERPGQVELQTKPKTMPTDQTSDASYGSNSLHDNEMP